VATPDGSTWSPSVGKILKAWGGKRESNPQPSEPQSGALPVELFPPLKMIIATAMLAVRGLEKRTFEKAEPRREDTLLCAGLRPGPRRPRRPSPHGLYLMCSDRPIIYPRPTPTYSKPRARRRVESSRFLVSTMTGFFRRCLMRSKSSARNSGHPVPTTSASEPSAAA
jgi:hypothetical protein